MRYFVTFEDSGVPTTALTPTAIWLNGDGTSAGAAPTVTELDAGDAPGWYYFDAAPAVRIVVTVDGGGTLPAADRYAHMVISPDDYPQTNKRVVYSAWDSRGNPTAGKILLYESAADLAADVSPWAGAEQTWDFVATYDTNNRITVYTQDKA